MRLVRELSRVFVARGGPALGSSPSNVHGEETRAPLPPSSGLGVWLVLP